MQGLAGVASSSHSPSLVYKKVLLVKSARVCNGLSFTKNYVSICGNNQTALKRDCLRLKCHGSSSASEVDDANSPKSDDLFNIVLNSSDLDPSTVSQASNNCRNEFATRPPKFSTLRAFGEAGAGVVSGLEGSVLELLAENIQATADLKRFETLSGRMAMMSFFVAIGVEVVTGNSVFKGIDIKELGQFVALTGVATLTAAGFAFSWRARSDVATSLSKGALKLVDTAVDNLIDCLFYDEEEQFK